MNQYTQLLYYIKSLADADGFVNTVTKNGSIDLDLFKGNLFPIFDVVITQSSFPSPGVISFTVQFICVDLRDINKEVLNEKFWENDNEVDNLNETLATLNRVWVRMNRDFDDKDITASDNPTLDTLEGAGANIYDGWIITTEIQMPNTTLNLCT